MLLSLEGLPGAGKTTQARLLADRLAREGHRVVYLPDLETLNTDPLGEMLAALFAFTGDPFMRLDDVVTETYLAAAIRTNIVATRIEPEMAANDVVIEDRGIHTMYSYALATLMQRHTVDLEDAVEWLTAIGGMTGRQAERALWIQVPFEVAVARATGRAGQRFTDEQLAYLRCVERAYDELARRDSRLIVVDVRSLDLRDAHDRVCRIVRELGGGESPGRTNADRPAL